MSKADRFEVDGVVIDCLPGSKFKVELENGHICTCTLSGKIRVNNIRILTGDKVTIDLSTSDPTLTNGRIIYRNK
jgi:translation initiation factor IF-1